MAIYSLKKNYYYSLQLPALRHGPGLFVDFWIKYDEPPHLQRGINK